MTQLCAISGPVRDRAGNLLSGQEVTFTYRGNVVGGDAGAVVPRIVTATTSGGGHIAVSLYSGQYRVQIDVPSARLSFNIGVPDAPTAVFGDLIDQAPPVTPDVLAQVNSARDTTVAASALAVEAAAAAEASRDIVLAAPTNAYELAVANGFVGTEAEWLATLVGPQGETGPPGPQGPTGPTGATGASGPQGPQGVQGETGPAGPDGADGTSVTILGSLASTGDLPGSGTAGDAYLIGGDLHVWTGAAWENVGTIQGPAGPTGATGPQGPTGPTGPAGANGTDAEVTTANVQAAGALMDSEVGDLTALKTLQAPDDTTISVLGKDLVGATTAPAMRTVMALGTASIATVTTSQTDTTAGRVLKVGDFGLGNVLNPPLLDDLDSTTKAEGSYRIIDTTPNLASRPAGMGVFGGLKVTRSAATAFSEIIIDNVTGRRWQRHYRQANIPPMSPWAEIFTSTSLPVTTHTRAFLATATDEASRVAIGIGTNGSLPTVSYTARASLPANGALPDGTIAAAEGLLYVAEEDATVLDKTGWLPFGEEKPGHWGAGSGRFTSRINYIKDRVDTGWYLSDFGAITDGGDVSAVLETAIESTAAERTKHLTLNPGRFFLGARVVADLPTDTVPQYNFVMKGQNTVLVVPQSNTVGGLKITKGNAWHNIELHDLMICSDHLVLSGTTGGIGLEIESRYNAASVLTSQRDILLHNVNVVPSNLGAGAAARGRWNTGIRVDGGWFLEMSHCNAMSSHPENLTPDLTTNYESGNGIDIISTYSPVLVSCRSAGRWNRNIAITEFDGNTWEDFQVTGCYGTGGRVGLEISMQSAARQATTQKEPGGRISGGHFNGHEYGIYVADRGQFTIDGVLVYLNRLDLTGFKYPNGAFIRIEDCHDVSITQCQMPAGGHYVSDADCTRGVHITGESHNVRVTNNQIGHNGIGIVHDSTGTSNTADGNDFDSYTVAVPTSGLTKKVVDTAGTLRGGDAPQTRTPSLEIDGASTGITYGTRTATFVKSGRTVMFSLRLVTTSKGSLTGDIDVVIPDLPLPAQGGDFGFFVGFNAGYGGLARSAVLLNTGKLSLFQTGTTRVTNANLSDASEIRISGTYETDE